MDFITFISVLLSYVVFPAILLAIVLLLIYFTIDLWQTIFKDEFRVLIRANSRNEFLAYVDNCLDTEKNELFKLKGKVISKTEIKNNKILVVASKQKITFHYLSTYYPKYVGTGNYFRYKVDLTN